MPTKDPNRIFDFYPLEDRILLSGEGFDGNAVEVDPAITDALLAEVAAGEATAASAPVENADNRLDSDEFADRVDVDPALPIEVVFVDAGVQDAETLIAGLRESGESQTEWIVIELTADEDGVDQITRTLAQLSGVDAVHIVSHGDGEGIQLGNTRLDVDTAAGYASDIASWADSLDADGDLLIYGCDLASTADGRALIESFSALCDCDVAASDDTTGTDSLGGDWDLEYTVGSVDVGVAFNSHVQSSWHGLLATYTVTNTNATGAGSLDQAIQDSNSTIGITDTIDFNISTLDSGYRNPDAIPANGDEYWTIRVASGGLTTLLDSVILDATTQPGYSGNPVIELDGTDTPPAMGINGIRVRTSNSTVRGFIVHSFGDEGIEIDGSATYGGDSNLIENNWVGLDGTGAAAGNAEHGIMISVNADNNIIRNNISADNGYSGIIINDNSNNNIVEGNYIGVGTDGATIIANGDHGILIQVSSSGNLIGGTAPGAGNVISGNTLDGIQINGSNDNIVQGNFIGTDYTGTLNKGNGDDGVAIQNGSTNNTIGGTTSAERNIISGNTGAGVYMDGVTTTGNRVIGNYIGTELTGTANLGNGAGGADSGVRFYQAGANTVGGTSAGEGNIIAYSGRFGVEVGTTSTGITIRGNSIFSNDEIGIDLDGGTEDAYLVTSNDSGDGDNGVANNLQNFPVLTKAFVTPTDITISGWLDSNLSTMFGIDFFATATADPSNHGQGKRYLGSTTTSTDGASNFTSFNATFTAAVAAGEFITATATDANGNTSEFSVNITAAAETASLWLSTDGAGAATSHGLESWSGGDVIELSDPNLALVEPGTSNGTFSHVFDLDSFAAGAKANALHYVTRDITVGNTTKIDLFAGDVLFSTVSDATLISTNRLVVQDEDLIIFRPDAPGDYTSGTFMTLIDYTDINTGDRTGWTLVEQDTVVGGTNLSAGDFLYAKNGSSDIYHFVADEVGDTTSASTDAVLIEGADIDGEQDIWGIELIEEAITIGGKSLSSGQILVTLAAADGSFGDNGISVADTDIIILNVTATEPGTTAATASLLMEGADVELAAASENLSAIALAPQLPLFVDLDANDSVAPGRDFVANFVTGSGPASIVDSDAVIDDTASGTLDSLAATITNLLDGVSESLSADTSGTSITAVYNSGTGELSLAGTDTVSNYQQVLRTITYDNVAGTPIATARTIDFVANDGTNLSNSATTTLMIDGALGGSLWISTDANVTSPGADGLSDGWREGEVLNFGGPDLQFGGATDGDLSKLFDFDPFISGTADSTGLHYVSRDLTVGSGANTFDLWAGDVLVTFAQDETILGAYYETGTNTLVHNQDLLVFRADSQGDYSSGTFHMLLDEVVSNRFRGITLVEEATTIGVTSLAAGDFLFVQETAPSEDIYHFATTGVGAGAKTTGTISTLIDGSDLNIATAISGIDLIESTTNVGGKILGAGSILVNLNANTSSVAANNLETTVNDIFVLEVTATGIGTTAATASMFLDGSDVGLDGSGGAERLFGFTLMPSDLPVAQDDTYTIAEDTTLNSSDTWWDSNWNARRTLSFNNLSQTENLADFPVLVALDSTRIDYSQVQDNGEDLRFVDGDGTLLAHEIETWDESGTSYVWVKVQQIDGASENDFIQMYYGNTGAADGQNANGVWDTGYAGVWHLNDDPSLGAGAITDSTNNPNDGTASNMDATDQVTGRIGGALDFDGATEYVRIGSTATDDLAITGNQLVIESWVYRTGATGAWQAPVARQLGSGADDSYVVAAKYDAPDQFILSTNDGASGDVVFSASDALPVNQWQYITAVHDGTDMIVYSDGVQVGSISGAGSIATDLNDLIIGGSENGATSAITEFFMGQIDEVRISDANRSADWIAAQYRSMTDHFVSYGDEQSVAGALGNDLSGDLLSAFLISGPSNAASFAFNADGSFTYTATADFSGVDSFTYKANDGDSDSNVATVTINVTPLNDSPTVATNTGTTVLEGATGTAITTSMLNEGDIDDSGAGLTYTVTDVTDNGTMYLAGFGALGLNDTFTQADVDAGDVTYDHDDSETTSDAFSFSLADGGEDGSTPATGTFSFTVTLVNDNSITATSDNNGATDVVLENTTVGTTVGVTAFADDADTGDTVSYSLDNNDGGRFAINSSSGVVTVAGAIDREADGATRSITVRATSTDTSSTTQVFVIAIADVDEFDVGAVTDADVTANAVNENATVGTAVGIDASASDADATNNTITYSLQDNDGGRFTINSSTGVVTVNGAIDREADGASRSITVRATSSDTSFTDQIFAIAINDVDEFNVGAVTDTDVTFDAVNENATVGTLVGINASAGDADATNNAITYSLQDNDGGRFAINSSTGVVTVNGAIDREADGASRNITVRATSSDTSFTDQVFAITINDVDEFNVGAVADTDVTVNAVNENATVGSVVGIDASASDADATNNTITYSLQDNDGGRFAINSSTGVVTVNGAIDREADGASRNITVRATSSDTSFTDQIYAIAINDADEFNVGAVTDTDVTVNAVNENATVGTAVGIDASASDADATNSTITYSLQDNDGGRFAINSSTGVVTVNGAIDREADGASRNITVRATSSDTSFTDQIYAIAINDVDEFNVGAVADTDVTVNAVNENAAAGTLVGIDASASDADATNNTITYSLFDNDGGRFTINSSTGVVTVNGAIDREADGASRNITVRATSSDTSFTDQVIAIAINDVDEYDVGAVTDAELAANAVNENATVGTMVGVTASASDADATNNTITYSLQDNDGGRFAINSITGVVTVNGVIDREADGASRNITVRATSSDTSFTDQVYAIAINDVDEFNVGAVTDSDATANAVNENATVGTVVGIDASASDADATNNTITYSLQDNDGGRFTINSGTGVVTVNGAIDREADGASRNITVRATSSDTSFTDQIYAIAIDDVDEFDVGAVTDTDVTADAVNENATIGTVVGIDASASDSDATNNTITYSLQDNDGGRFAINSSTGVVTVNGAIDREADGPTRNITVRATSLDTSFTDQLFAININDVDEFDIGAISDSDVATDEVIESAANGTTVGITALATDSDATDNTTYSLDDTAGGRFAINATTGIITVANTSLLDYETTTSHNVTVRATSDDASFSTAIFTINLLDDASESGAGPISDTDATLNSLAENALAGATVGITAFATDADITDTISYSLDDNAAGRFAINATTGVVTLLGGIDAESATSHNITVRATSTDTSFSTAVFLINVSDVDEFDVGAVTDADATLDAVDENAIVGSTVGITASASDSDVTTNTITYSLQDNDGGRFAINSSTGVVTVAGAIDREADGASRNIIVRATSSDLSFTDQGFAIAINDLDEFDVGTITDSDATANSVDENATVGTVVGVTAMASDADATNNTITYSLQHNDGGRFAINSSTGVVTVAGAIDRETDGGSRNITVRATSSDTSFTDQVFAIAINDVDEFDTTATSDSDLTINAVSENATVGTIVGVTASAGDADATDTITYSLDDNDGGRFAINASTGVVTVAGAIDREADGATRSITVSSTSTDASFTTQAFVININDVDEFDVGAVTDTDLTLNAVNENATVGTVVGLAASAGDADATTNSITYSLQDNDGGRFAINSSTGVVTVSGVIDREADGASRNITVRATSADTSFTDQVFAITINDLDEFNVGAVADTDVTPNAVNENAAIGTVVGIDASASDADATNNTITYTLQDNDGGRFAINSSTGVVTVSGVIDREADGASRNITVRATSADTSFTDQAFAININDLDEYDIGAVTDSDLTTDEVNESAANGTAVGITALATDTDATDNTTYSLDDNAAGRFAINATTGVITVANTSLLDYETTTSHNVTVRATSDDASFSTAVLVINLLDDPSESAAGPVSDTDATANSLPENASAGATVGITAFATDADITDTISYSLDDNAGGRFAINATTGVVTLVGGIDAESSTSHNIIVRATSTDTSFSTAAFVINITDVDEFDVGGISDTDATVNAVNENATVGTLVGLTAFAEDLDVTTNTITYSLQDNAGGRFAINSSSGLVTVSGAIDYETATSHNITVRATSTDSSTATQVFMINVGDVNEAPVASGDAYSVNSGDTLTVNTPGVLAGDVDVDGDPLMAILVTPPTNGTVSLLANGTLVYTPNPGFFGVDTIQYQASDGSLLSNLASVTITVNAIVTDPDPDPDPIPDPDPDPDDDGDDPIDEDSDGDDDESTDDSDTSTTDGSSSAADPELDLSRLAGGSKAAESPAVSMESADEQAVWLREFYSYKSSRLNDVGAEYSLQLEMFGRLLQLDLEQAIVWQQWDQSTHDDGGSTYKFYVGAAGVASGLFSVGYVMWALRGGAFLAAVTSTLPGWRLVDPTALLSAYRAARAGTRDSVEDLIG